MDTDPDISMLRHTLATLAYRAEKALRNASDKVAGFKAGPAIRTPAQILAHMGDLMDWGSSLADGQHVWHDSEPLAWADEVRRFFAALERFDQRLASGTPLGKPASKLFQGPVADALTHVGQIALLRRMADDPIKGENYYRANIEAGRVGLDQPPAVREFD